jgi:hypothetical protein
VEQHHQGDGEPEQQEARDRLRVKMWMTK